MGLLDYDPIQFLNQQFRSGCSVLIIIIVLAISIGVITIIYQYQVENPGGLCLFEFKGKLSHAHPWKIFSETFRGDNYYALDPATVPADKVSAATDVAKQCMVTEWGFAHFLMYAILGFAAPRLFWPLFVIGIMWELFETFAGCHCMLDLVWNFLGLCVGVVIRQALFPIYV